jgi:hypothetical protein
MPRRPYRTAQLLVCTRREYQQHPKYVPRPAQFWTTKLPRQINEMKQLVGLCHVFVAHSHGFNNLPSVM